MFWGLQAATEDKITHRFKTGQMFQDYNIHNFQGIIQSLCC